MELSSNAREILENLWVYWVYLDGNDDEFIRRNLVEKTAIGELEDLNLVNFEEGQLRLTPEGFQESGKIIKNLKLSLKLETMFNDFVGGKQESGSVKYSDSKYTIKCTGECSCNHSSTPGSQLKDKPSCSCGGNCKCAENMRRVIEDLSLPLSQIQEGQSCKVSYIRSSECKNLRKILSIGILPGMEIKLVQKNPNHVFLVNNNQISVDNEIAESIFVGVCD